MKREKVSLNNDDIALVATLLKLIGITYSMELEGKDNIRTGTKCLEESLKINRELIPGNLEERADILRLITFSYLTLGEKDKLPKGLASEEEALKIYHQINPDNEENLLISLALLAEGYQNLDGDENLKKAIIYGEAFLRIHGKLFSGKNEEIAAPLNDVGLSYQKLHDREKALEYFKQAYSIISPVTDAGKRVEKIVKSNIQIDQRDFFTKIPTKDCYMGNRVGAECRWIISSRGIVDGNLLKIKQRIQGGPLYYVGVATRDRGWSSIGLFGGEWGVKGYFDREHLKSELGELGKSDENLEIAQMLVFEAMCLGVI